MSDVPVLVAGGGPAGLAAAAELSLHGVACVILEPRAQVSHRRPRAKTTSVRTMEHLRRWGLADELRKAAPLPVAWSQRVTFCESLTGARITDFDGAFGLVTTRDDRFAEAGQQVPQPVVEEVLRAHLQHREGVDLRLGHAAVSLEQEGDRVTVTARDPAGSPIRSPPATCSAATAPPGFSATRSARDTWVTATPSPTSTWCSAPLAWTLRWGRPCSTG